MSEPAAGPELTVVLREPAPAERCLSCDRFAASNRHMAVVPVDEDGAEAVRQGAVCEICVEHYGLDGIAARMWPDICDWVPFRVLEPCQCETCTGQIEFRMTAGTDFYD